METPKKIHLISHSHWDREWYLPFEVFRYRLVRMMDRLLQTLEDKPCYRFHLDGQMIIMEDYLEIRPERKPLIQRFVQNGQLTIGPWYVLIDEFLVSGESIIRNLEEGRRLGVQYGPMMKVGYLPDSFGHIAQMPLILKQFGIEYAVIWRGLNGKPEEAPTEFEWEATNGDTLKTIHLSHYYGYTSAMNLPENLREASERIHELIGKIGEYSQSGHIVLMNGFDHMESQEHIPDVINEWNKDETVPMVHSSLEDYVKESMENVSLSRLKGEFRHTSRASNEGINTILPNVLSSRVYLKQQNAECQNTMEKWVEPLEALTLSLFKEHHPAFVRQAWKYILQNHPHDSICGCSIDEVHREMETRFMKAGQIGKQIVVDALQMLGNRMDQSWISNPSTPLLVFNSLPWVRQGCAEFEMDVQDDRVYRSVSIVDDQGQHYKGEIISVRKECPIEWYSGKYPLNERETNRHFIRAVIHDIPAMGYKLLAVQLKESPCLDALPTPVSTHAMENEYIRVLVEANGTLTLTDLESGRQMRGLHCFEDSGDVGDEYSYSSPIVDERFVGAALKSVSVKGGGRGWKRMRVEYELHIPKAADALMKKRSEEKLAITIISEITLMDSSRTLCFKTIVDNMARDHRLRLLFPMAKDSAPIRAGGHYEIASRAAEVIQPNENIWVENEPTTFPFLHFVYGDHGPSRFIFNAKGLHEYEWVPSGVSEKGTLAITLFRSVSHLGGADRGMSTSNRPGPGLKTEEGQCLRNMVFEYGITVGSTVELAQPWKIANEQEIEVQARILVPDVEMEKTLPAQLGWLELNSESVYMSSLRPVLNNKKGFELRLVNLGNKTSKAHLSIHLPFKSVFLVTLDGTIIQPLVYHKSGDQSQLDIALKAGDIATLQFVSPSTGNLHHKEGE